MSFTDRMLRSITEHFEDLRHFPSGPQVHPETGHGTLCGQADYTGGSERGRETKGVTGKITGMMSQIFISLVLKTKINKTERGTAYFQISINICDFHHVLFFDSRLFTLFSLHVLN